MSSLVKLVSDKKLYLLFYFLFITFSVNSFNEFAKTSTNEKDPIIPNISITKKDSSNFDEYILGPGDKIYIEFLNIKELSGIFEIGPTGHIYLPRIGIFLQMVLALRN